MQSKLIVVIALFGLAAAIPTAKLASGEEESLFNRFKSEHGKSYKDVQDEMYRKGVFVRNVRMIRAHNEGYAAGLHTYNLAMNKFGDMPFEEFHAKYTGFLGARHSYLRSQNTADLSHVVAAESVDWTTKGAVTPVKDQGQCGSCWAFSSTGSIEGAWFLSNGTLFSLSEQELMDCSQAEGNESCEGGLMDDAFEYVQKKGLCSEASYPYKERDEACKQTCQTIVTISSFSDVGHSEAELAAAVTQQPVSIAIEADQSAFQFYSSGVLTGECGTNLDHGVLAVGYGTLGSTQYWKVKNSWGASWGMDGYILIEKGKNQDGGQCGILLAASYPVV